MQDRKREGVHGGGGAESNVHHASRQPPSTCIFISNDARLVSTRLLFKVATRILSLSLSLFLLYRTYEHSYITMFQEPNLWILILSSVKIHAIFFTHSTSLFFFIPFIFYSSSFCDESPMQTCSRSCIRKIPSCLTFKCENRTTILNTKTAWMKQHSNEIHITVKREESLESRGSNQSPYFSSRETFGRWEQMESSVWKIRDFKCVRHA